MAVTYLKVQLYCFVILSLEYSYFKEQYTSFNTQNPFTNVIYRIVTNTKNFLIVLVEKLKLNKVSKWN